jgi:cell division protease FtsH
MENHPTHPQPPTWSPDVGTAKGFVIRPAPPWLWLIVILLLMLIFWHFVPKAEVEVPYAPWFLQQVEADNIESLSLQGTEVRGVLRQLQPYQRTPSTTPVQVLRFSTCFPSEASIEPVIQKLLRPREGPSPPVEIVAHPPTSTGFTAWLVLWMPIFLILGVMYLMMRRDRDRFDGPPRGQSP